MKASDGNELFPNAIRVVRCRRSHRYFTGAGWSRDPAKAKGYASRFDVAEACVSHNLHEVEMVVRSQVSGTELFCTGVR